MASTSPGYGITIHVDGPASAQPVSEITQAILAAGASITALDVVESDFAPTNNTQWPPDVSTKHELITPLL